MISSWRPLGSTPWRIARARSALLKLAPTPPRPRVRLGATIRPSPGSSINTLPARLGPWQSTHAATALARCCPRWMEVMSVGTAIVSRGTSTRALRRLSLTVATAAQARPITSAIPSASSPMALSAARIASPYSTKPTTMYVVKLCYALRRGVFYPSARDEFGEMPPRAERRRYLPLVKAMGFAAVEVPADESVDERSARDLAR